MRKFWELDSPLYASDYRRTFINGSLEHPYTLPTVCCEKCCQRSFDWRVLPFLCPPSMRRNKFLRDYEDDVSVAEFSQVCSKLAGTLRRAGVDSVQFSPGAKLQPCFLDIPSRPTADFLWPGTWTIVVSDRVKQALLGWNLDGVAFCPVVLRKVGKRSPRASFRMPSTGEPEDLVTGMKRGDTAPYSASYFELVVAEDMPDPPGVEPCQRCSLCGERVYEDREGQHWSRVHRSEELAWASLKNRALTRMAAGRDIIRSAGRFICTGRVKDHLERIQASNVAFVPFPKA